MTSKESLLVTATISDYDGIALEFTTNGVRVYGLIISKLPHNLIQSRTGTPFVFYMGKMSTSLRTNFFHLKIKR